MRSVDPLVFLSPAILVAFCLDSPVALAVSANGSLEGDVTPVRASPSWSGSDNEQPSLTDWVTTTNGLLTQKPGTPPWAWMRLVPTPLTTLSYTVEARFRITGCDMTNRYTFPLGFVFSNNDLCATQINVGRQGTKGAMQTSSAGSSATVNDAQIIAGKWMTVRLVVEGGVKTVRTKTFLNGEIILEVPDGAFREYDWFHVRSDGGEDSWEIDYVRWKNTALDIDIPLDKPLTTEEMFAELLR